MNFTLIFIVVLLATANFYYISQMDRMYKDIKSIKSIVEHEKK